MQKKTAGHFRDRQRGAEASGNTRITGGRTDPLKGTRIEKRGSGNRCAFLGSDFFDDE